MSSACASSLSAASTSGSGSRREAGEALAVRVDRGGDLLVGQPRDLVGCALVAEERAGRPGRDDRRVDRVALHHRQQLLGGDDRRLGQVAAGRRHEVDVGLRGHVSVGVDTAHRATQRLRCVPSPVISPSMTSPGRSQRLPWWAALPGGRAREQQVAGRSTTIVEAYSISRSTPKMMSSRSTRPA